MNTTDIKEIIVKCISVIVCVAVLLVTACVCADTFTNNNNSISKLISSTAQDTGLTNSSSASTDITYNNSDLTTDTTVSDGTDKAADTDESVSNKSTDADSNTDTNTFKTTDEIVNYFNTAVNRIKPNAKKVVKNFEKRTFHEDLTDIPDAIESVAEGMVSSMMGDDTEPIVYATKEEIEANFIVPEQSYSSKLENTWVKSASCKDNGKEYIIQLELKDHKNPTAGKGVGAVCDVIETHEVANKVSFVEEFSTLYYNCKITATIDKATGNVTHIVYTTPLLLNMTVNLLGTHTGVVAFTFEKDYTITY